MHASGLMQCEWKTMRMASTHKPLLQCDSQTKKALNYIATALRLDSFMHRIYFCAVDMSFSCYRKILYVLMANQHLLYDHYLNFLFIFELFKYSDGSDLGISTMNCVYTVNVCLLLCGGRDQLYFNGLHGMSIREFLFYLNARYHSINNRRAGSRGFQRMAIVHFMTIQNGVQFRMNGLYIVTYVYFSEKPD